MMQQYLKKPEDEQLSKKYESREDLYADPVVSFLLNSIDEPEVENYLVNDFLSDNGSEFDPAMVNKGAYFKTKAYFRRNSPISAAVMSYPGTSVLTELLYEQKPATPIDEYFVYSEAGDAVHDRLESIIENVGGMVNLAVERKGTAEIGNIGSGPGRDTIEIVRKLDPQIRKHVKVTLLDKDMNALEEGRELAKYHGVVENFDFKKTDLKKAFNPLNKNFWSNRNNFDFGLMIGIICPMDMKSSRLAIRGAGRLLNSDGRLITSAAHKNMKREDPFTDYIMRRLGLWEMRYKDEKDMDSLYEDSGLSLERIFYDEPRRFHNLAVGKRKGGLSMYL